MEYKKYSVILADGTTLTDLSLNGNNFISKVALNPSTFDGNCCPVVISDGEVSENHPNMALVQITTPVEGEYWFVLRDRTDEELKAIRDRSDVEYLAMMCDIEL